MLQHATGLDSTALEAIADLERRVLAADGGRLKLEWGALRSRPVDEIRDLLWWEDGRLLGFLGIYGSGRQLFELAGMVDPAARRRGIGRELFDAALPLVSARGVERLLTIVPRPSESGHEFCRSRGMTYEHSEHALSLRARPEVAAADPLLDIRQATTDDIPKLSELFRDGFGDDGYVDPDRLASGGSRTQVITLDGVSVGTIAVTRDGARGAIYGFVVESSHRGHGIGRQALRRACSELFDAGADHVDLEVEVENDRALGLYTSVGFSLLATDDYYELML
jgi:ribosomal protein S18 acetylase RimI-like enzyme